ncbi:MAG: hypothetical protein EZS28_056116, partial [Streblomastix strix]
MSSLQAGNEIATDKVSANGVGTEWNTTYLYPQRQGGHYLRPRKRKSEDEILNDILERYKTNKQSDVEQS